MKEILIYNLIAKKFNKANIGYPDVQYEYGSKSKGVLECSCPACINLMRFFDGSVSFFTVAKLLRSSERFDVESIGRDGERIIFAHPAWINRSGVWGTF